MCFSQLGNLSKKHINFFMRKLVASKRFQKKLSFFLKQNPHLERKAQKTLSIMERDLFSVSLRTHKLSGKLKTFYGSWIDYYQRITFSYDENYIYLLNIGDHDEVY